MRRLTHLEERMLLYDSLFCRQSNRLILQYYRLIIQTIKKALTIKGISPKPDLIEGYLGNVIIQLKEDNCRRLWKYCETVDDCRIRRGIAIRRRISLASWIILITNRSIRPVSPDNLSFDEMLENVYADGTFGEYESQYKDDILLLVKNRIRTFKPRERLILMLSFYYGHSDDMIARTLKMKIGSVYTARHRALNRLRASVRRHLLLNSIFRLDDSEGTHADGACKDKWEKIRTASVRLPARYRDLFDLYYIEGLSINNLSRKLEVDKCGENLDKDLLECRSRLHHLVRD